MILRLQDSAALVQKIGLIFGSFWPLRLVLCHMQVQLAVRQPYSLPLEQTQHAAAG